MTAGGHGYRPVRMGRLESQWTTVHGLSMHARVSIGSVPPDAPRVVLVHGVGISSRYMVPTAVRLAPDYRVFAPDLPGFGKSVKPPHVLNVRELADALRAWMDLNDVHEAVLIGNSLGCQIISDLAVRYPQYVLRAVLQGPTVDPQGRTWRQQLVRWLRDSQREPPSQAVIMLRDYRAAGLRRVIRTFQYTLDDRIEERLPRMRNPTLVVRGTRDPIIPQRWAEEATRLLPNGKLVVIPGATHTINYAAPLEFVRVLRPFIDGACSHLPEAGA
ncbi:MAG: alpha/beta hydrolase [Chloroflexota bacterium]|nr:alpha/beta hydrolase [Chloroflexota bacterium]PLS82639.1 MAG: alpha/beta hydrolase [Chloroflexota bacterium]